ncbi:protein translocase subunit SecF [Rhodococcus antarcticus]|uniref:Protein-export membrane protein SecF n=1 Tax=Rhodococcus antarcticus TaxID=2987751 RepID=A0ABY6P371_9NOCA|nr:protein translocase subunit SecF [Rhodococcus antarcticus]UZJ26100.1 protein translocase subunit SecF [Rhodococcus antarcticus]
MATTSAPEPSDADTVADEAPESPAGPPPVSTEARGSVFSRLYTGTGAFDVIGHRKRFYVVSVVLLLVSIVSLLTRGFNLGIDFEGGTQVSLPSGSATTEQVQKAYTDALGMDPVQVVSVGSGGSSTIQIRSVDLAEGQVETLKQALFTEFQPVGADGVASVNAISDSAVSSTWGGEITNKAIIALIVFLVLVTVFIAIRFERDMAVAALVSLFHDIVVTAGVYSLVGFEVTPGTVIGLLTILGFSLYDTVVVFDKVQENTRGILGLTRRTYAEQTNLAVNQTFMRSINTTVIAVLPVLGLLVVGVGLLGVGTLKDLALVQLTGILVGTYSSIFLASPLLVTLKERSGEVAVHTKRVLARRESAKLRSSVPPELATAGATSGPVASPRTPSAPRSSAPRPGARPTGKRKR